MIRFVVSLSWMICMSAFALEEDSPPVEKPKTVEENVAAIRTATFFSIGGIGFAATLNPSEIALQALVKQPDGLAQCRRLLDTATPAGQLYALYGLKLLDPKGFQGELPRFQKSKTKVSAMSGCSGYEDTVGKIASQIDRRDFP
jgi:hypothetical protein